MQAFLRWCLAVTMSIGLFMVVFPGCGRSSLESEDLDASASSSGTTSSSSGGTTCGPSNCSNGCCDANGQCQTGRNERACGSIGSACRDCVGSGFDTCTDARVCSKTVTDCNPSNCSGCCAFDDTGASVCLFGTEATACGRDGNVCANCEDDGRACDLSTRSCGQTRCDASNCNGCCVGDLCLPGNSQFACGESGGLCGRCGPNQVCRLRGVGGGRCESTQTRCGPANCGGCCTVNGICIEGTNTNACGRLGQQCEVCNFNEQCVPDGFPGARTCQPITEVCGPGNCDGCCLGEVCIPTSDAFCGIKGQQCFSCGPNQQCNPAGFCENVNNCGPLSCGGCCIGDVCAIGLQNTACGFGGQTCQNCLNQGRTCSGGFCQDQTCGPANCPTGCCQGNTCVTGTQDTACGGNNEGGGGFPGGFQCQNCLVFGQTCQNKQCVSKCGPGNCNGCCNANGTCVTGISSNSCGQFGGTCDSCSSRGTFCNSLVTPRACNDAQKECPAPYGTCAPGTTTVPVKEKQNVCSTFDLDDIASACFLGADDFFCQLVINEKPFACQDCMNRFNHSFARRTGLFQCAASFVDGPCRDQLGCTTDCDEQSCSSCNSDTTETACYSLVNSGNGQCNKFSSQTSCANPALEAGELCSQFSYGGDYSSWLREVGDYFCGDGQ